MNIIVLGVRTNIEEEGFDSRVPHFLQEMNGKPVLELISESINGLAPLQTSYVFAKRDIDQWNLSAIIKQIATNSAIISAEQATAGAACSALLAIHNINLDDELLILSTNELVRQDLCPVLSDFRKRKLDAGVLSFRSVQPRYAYVRLDDNEKVIEVAEHAPISRNAICGIFWYARGRDFIAAAQSAIRKNASTKGAFYVSSSLNEMILKGLEIGIYPISIDQYMPMKTSRQLDIFENAAYIRGLDASF